MTTFPFLWISNILSVKLHLFIHASINRRYCRILDVAKKAAVNLKVHMHFWVRVSLPSDKHPEVGLLDHVVVLSLIFWEASTLFATVAAPMYSPGHKCTSISFSAHPRQHLLFAGLWMTGFLTAMRCYLVVWAAFPWWLMMLCIFSRACWPSVCLLWKNVYLGPLPIFNQFCFFLNLIICSLENHLTILWKVDRKPSHTSSNNQHGQPLGIIRSFFSGHNY